MSFCKGCSNDIGRRWKRSACFNLPRRNWKVWEKSSCQRYHVPTGSVIRCTFSGDQPKSVREQWRFRTPPSVWMVQPVNPPSEEESLQQRVERSLTHESDNSSSIRGVFSEYDLECIWALKKGSLGKGAAYQSAHGYYCQSHKIRETWTQGIEVSHWA